MGQPDGLVEWLGAQLDADEHRAWPHMVVVSGGHPSPGVPNCIGPSGTGDCQSGWRLEPPEGAGSGWWKAPVVQEAMREHGLSHATAEQRWRMADIAAKRAILELHQPRVLMRAHPTHRCQECGDLDEAPVTWPCPTVRHLATAYADRDGYRQEWRPDGQ